MIVQHRESRVRRVCVQKRMRGSRIEGVERTRWRVVESEVAGMGREAVVL